MNVNSRKRLWLGAALLLAISTVLAVVYGLPRLVQQQIETRASVLLGRAVAVQRVETSLLRLAVTVHGLSVGAASTDVDRSPQLAVQRLHADASVRSLWRLAPVLEELDIAQLQLRVARLAENALDIDDVLASLRAAADAKPTDPVAEPARFGLFNVQLRDSSILIDDRVVARQHRVQALNIALPFLSNLPEDIPVQVQPRLAFKLADTEIDLQGQTLPFSADRASELQWEWADLPLQPFWVYLPRDLGVQAQGGRLSTQLRLRFAQPTGQTPLLALTGTVELHDLKLQGAVAGTGAALRSLVVALQDVQPLQRLVVLGAVALDGLDLKLLRDAQGQLAWPGLKVDAAAAAATASSLTPSPGSSPQASPTPDPGNRQSWQVSAHSLALSNSSVALADAAVSPAVQWQVQDLAVKVDTPRWPVQGPVPVQASARVLAGSKSPELAALLSVQGQASPTQAKLELKLTDLALGAAAPYAAAFFKPRVEGQAAVQASLDWAVGDEQRLRLDVESASVQDLRVVAQPVQRGSRPLAQWSQLEVRNASIDLLAHTLNVGSVALRQPRVLLARDAAGVFNVQTWLPTDAAASSSGVSGGVSAGPSTSNSAPWQVALADLRIDDGRVQWDDLQPAAPVNLSLLGLRLRAQELRWPASSQPARVDMYARLPAASADGPARTEDAAQLAANGTVALAPFALRGRVDVQRLPLHRFEPYLAQLLPVKLARAELGWQGSINASLPEGAALGDISQLSLQALGQALVADLDLRTPPDAAALLTATEGEPLLSWQSLQIEPLRVNMSPGSLPHISVGELVLSDFYSRLVITEQGRFNLRDLQGAQAEAAQAEQTATAPAVVAVASASASAPGSTSNAAASALPLSFTVDATRLNAGRVDFTDRFIRPNYSAELTELNGSIGRFDSATPTNLATVDLRGRVAGTGLLNISGALNPTAQPLAMNIRARTTDLELAPFSPYSGKYAGYAIERGKLSVDVNYNIGADGSLQASNQIILNQLTFGAAVDSPDATSLPVRLAVALLADRNGIIDLNLPLTGSINDPQFSIWGLVWKIVGNLFTKIVTAPFSLFSGGDTDELSSIAFAPGTAQMAADSKAAIGKLAQVLQDRPSLQMTVAGHADLKAEAAAMRAAAIDQALLTEQSRELARAGAANAPPPPLSAADSARLLKRLYTESKLPDRPRNFFGFLKDIPAADMRARLEAAVPVTSDTVRELALQRGLRVRDALIALGLPSERLFLGAPKTADAAADAPFKPRVELTLAVP